MEVHKGREVFFKLIIVFGLLFVIIISGAELTRIMLQPPRLLQALAQQQGTSMIATNATADNPGNGYNMLIVNDKHIFDSPNLPVYHYCKLDSKVLAACLLYDSDSKNATLIGVDYIITIEQYYSLPDREKPYWHYHKQGFFTDTYGKTIITWNPLDKLPSFPPQVQLLDHPFMVNANATK